MKDPKGNALFLILIAVALFAALSYAITQSSRGGAGVDRERAEILAAQIMSEMATFQQAALRLKVAGGYEQVQFNEQSTDNDGTCYSGGNTYTCRVVGFFSDEVGLPYPNWTREMLDPAFSSDTMTWNWTSRPLQVNGVDVGTAASDEYITLRAVKKEICEAVNRKVNDDPAITAMTFAPSPDGYARQSMDADGILSSLLTAPGTSNGTNIPNYGCISDENGRNIIILSPLTER